VTTSGVVRTIRSKLPSMLAKLNTLKYNIRENINVIEKMKYIRSLVFMLWLLLRNIMYIISPTLIKGLIALPITEFALNKFNPICRTKIKITRTIKKIGLVFLAFI
jgi:hypothetical protein